LSPLSAAGPAVFFPVLADPLPLRAAEAFALLPDAAFSAGAFVLDAAFVLGLAFSARTAFSADAAFFADDAFVPEAAFFLDAALSADAVLFFPAAPTDFSAVSGALAVPPDRFVTVPVLPADRLAAPAVLGASAEAFFSVTHALSTAVAAFFFAAMAATPSHMVIFLVNRSGTINRLRTGGNGARRLTGPPCRVGRPVCMRCAQLTARYAGTYR